MADLEKCPFCGGKAILVALAPCHGYISCIGECGFHSGDFWDSPMTDLEKNRTKWSENATKAWNRRYEPKGKLEFDYGAEVE